MDTVICHPDDISFHHMSSGWLSGNWYLIRMSYDNVIMSSGWHAPPFLSHPDDIANFDFPHHAVALQRFRIYDIWFKVVFDLEGKGQSLPNTIVILMKMFCILYIWEISARVSGCGKKLIHTKLRIVSIYEIEIQRTQGNRVGRFLPPGGRNRIKPRFKPSRKK